MTNARLQCDETFVEAFDHFSNAVIGSALGLTIATSAINKSLT